MRSTLLRGCLQAFVGASRAHKSTSPVQSARAAAGRSSSRLEQSGAEVGRWSPGSGAACINSTVLAQFDVLQIDEHTIRARTVAVFRFFSLCFFRDKGLIGFPFCPLLLHALTSEKNV